jgi:hypothetical protein
MAARRLLIVMLILLGLSTLAAALVPQHTLQPATSTGNTTTRALTTPAEATRAPGYLPPTKITVGGKKFPIVSPVHVGDQLTLLVASRVPTQLEIQEFGQVAFAAPNAPARFELLANTPGTFGIQFLPSGKVAAQIRVVPPGKGKTKKKRARSRARGGSGRP